MCPRPPDLERALAAALATRCEAYADACAALTALQQRLDAGSSLHVLCPELHQVLGRVRAADDELAPLQSQWQGLSVPAGPELAAEMERHQVQLEQTLVL